MFECVEAGRKQLQRGLNKNPSGSSDLTDRIKNQTVLERTSEGPFSDPPAQSKADSHIEPVSPGHIQGNLGNLQGWRPHEAPKAACHSLDSRQHLCGGREKTQLMGSV